MPNKPAPAACAICNNPIEPGTAAGAITTAGKTYPACASCAAAAAAVAGFVRAAVQGGVRRWANRHGIKVKGPGGP